MECVDSTAEFVYKYQMPGRNLSDILQGDREKLKELQQPGQLNDQLIRLYTEIEESQRGNGLQLEESDTTTSSSSADESNINRRLIRRRVIEFHNSVLYEENAPFP